METGSAEAVILISKAGFKDHAYASIVLDITRLWLHLDIFYEARILLPRMRCGVCSKC